MSTLRRLRRRAFSSSHSYSRPVSQTKNYADPANVFEDYLEEIVRPAAEMESEFSKKRAKTYSKEEDGLTEEEEEALLLAIFEQVSDTVNRELKGAEGEEAIQEALHLPADELVPSASVSSFSRRLYRKLRAYADVSYEDVSAALNKINEDLKDRKSLGNLFSEVFTNVVESVSRVITGLIPPTVGALFLSMVIALIRALGYAVFSFFTISNIFFFAFAVLVTIFTLIIDQAEGNVVKTEEGELPALLAGIRNLVLSPVAFVSTLWSIKKAGNLYSKSSEVYQEAKKLHEEGKSDQAVDKIMRFITDNKTAIEDVIKRKIKL
jgi:hypothetical protein